MVLDERRVAGTLFTDEESICKYFWRFWECCFCFCHREAGGLNTWQMKQLNLSDLTHPSSSSDSVAEAEGADTKSQVLSMDRIMRSYAKQLLRPAVKVVVILAFLVLLGLNIYFTTNLEQQFNIEGK